MKKILVCLLAFVLILSFTGCSREKMVDAPSGKPSESPSVTPDSVDSKLTESPSAVPDANISKPDESKQEPVSERLSDAFINTIKGEKYYMSYTVNVKGNGQEMKMEVVLAMDGKNSDTLVDMGGFKMHSLLKDGKYYMINDSEKTYQILDVPMDTNGAQMPSMDNDVVFTGSGTDTVNGKTLPYDEYKTDEGTARYFMDGKNLYAMVFKADSAEMLMIVKELSTTIPAGMLELPTDYKEGEGTSFNFSGEAEGTHDFGKDENTVGEGSSNWPASGLGFHLPTYFGSGKSKVLENSEDKVVIHMESVPQEDANDYFEFVQLCFDKEQKETNDNGMRTYTAKNNEGERFELTYKDGTMMITLNKD